MSRTRRTFSKEFKSKVVLESLKEKDTIEFLAKKYELLPTQISAWKAEAIRNMSKVFAKDIGDSKDSNIPTESFLLVLGN